MPMMKSLRAFRLANTSGHIIQVPADDPIFVPPALLSEALSAGMIEVDVPKPGAAPAPAAEPEPEPEQEEEVVLDRDEELNQALLRIMTRNDPDEFTGAGIPKVAIVNDELPPGIERVRGTEVVAAFETLQDQVNLAD